MGGLGLYSTSGPSSVQSVQAQQAARRSPKLGRASKGAVLRRSPSKQCAAVPVAKSVQAQQAARRSPKLGSASKGAVLGRSPEAACKDFTRKRSIKLCPTVHRKVACVAP